MDLPGPFTRRLEEVRPRVNERISDVLNELTAGHPLEERVCKLLMRGKRLRAGVTMMVHDAIGDGRVDPAMALDLAVAIELAHSCSLILDDMLDGDEERRGHAALHLSMGGKIAMLEAIRLLAIPYDLIGRHDPHLVGPLARTHRTMVEGVLLEMELSKGPSTWSGYDSVVASKTGELFSLAARYGALAAGASSAVAEVTAKYGLWVGMLAQLSDDAVDLQRMLRDRVKGGGSEVVLLRSLERHRAEGTLSDQAPASYGPVRSTADWSAAEAEIERRHTSLVDRARREVANLELGSPDRPSGVEGPTSVLLSAPEEIALLMRQ